MPAASAAAVTGPSSASVPGSGASAAGSDCRRGRSRNAARSSKPGMTMQAITNVCSTRTRVRRQGRDGDRSDTVPGNSIPAAPMRRSRLLAVGAVFAATVPAAAAVAPAPAGDSSANSGTYAQGTEIAAPRSGALALHAGPRAGRIIARVGERTAFGSPTRLAVVEDLAGWVGVVSDELGNGVQGYVRAAEVRLARKSYVLEADLSRRVLLVHRWGLVVRRVPIAIGAAASPTPIGRFSVTDVLSDFYPSVYGCCVLALS